MPPSFDLDGPAPAWPRPLDAALEWWAGCSGRARAAVRAGLTVLVLLVATGRLLHGPWGGPVDVVVAAGDLAAGARVTAADVVVARWPRELVPDDAVLAPAALPDDAVADGRLAAGQVLTHRSVRPGGPASAAPSGTAVVPVPATLLPPLPVGTRLDLAVADLGEAQVVATDAVLVADDGEWRWLRVDRDEVPAVARGVTAGGLVAAVLPPRRGDAP